MANSSKLWQTMANYGKLHILLKQTLANYGKLEQTLANFGKLVAAKYFVNFWSAATVLISLAIEFRHHLGVCES